MTRRFSRKEMKAVRLCRGDFPRYMPAGESKVTAIEDIMSLNKFIFTAKEKAGLNLFNMVESKILWNVPEDKTGLFTWVKHPDKTKTGKIPKYTEVLFFTVDDASRTYSFDLHTGGFSHGEIYYHDGAIGKSRIIQSDDNCNIFALHIKIVNKELSLWKIDRNGFSYWKK